MAFKRYLLACCLALAAVSVSADQMPFIASIPVELAHPKPELEEGQARLSLYAQDIDKLVTQLGFLDGVVVLRQGKESVSVMLSSPFSTLSTPSKAGYLNSSFVIDTEEASSQAFIAGFSLFDASDNVLDAIAGYTNEFITEPTYQHSFQIVSQVAASRSGDCTEYAVMTTALARAKGLPARVMFGTVVFNDGNAASAFGHAWTEVWYEDQWRIVDGALYDDREYDFWYLPAAELANEGFGYKFALANGVQYLPSKIGDFSSQ